MAKTMDYANDEKEYRAVIICLRTGPYWEDQEVKPFQHGGELIPYNYMDVYGPYNSPSQAKSQITRELKWLGYRDVQNLRAFIEESEPRTWTFSAEVVKK